jgi:hypothetical protein
MISLAGLLALVLTAVPAESAEFGGSATMSVLGGEIAWAPRGSADRYVLRVSGPGVDSVQRFVDGEPPVFALSNAEGGALADGSYTWELREELAPVNDGIRNAANGRDGDSTEVRQPVAGAKRLDWGAFLILNGAVVDPNAAEARPEPQVD